MRGAERGEHRRRWNSKPGGGERSRSRRPVDSQVSRVYPPPPMKQSAKEELDDADGAPWSSGIPGTRVVLWAFGNIPSAPLRWQEERLASRGDCMEKRVTGATIARAAAVIGRRAAAAASAAAAAARAQAGGARAQEEKTAAAASWQRRKHPRGSSQEKEELRNNMA